MVSNPCTLFTQVPGSTQYSVLDLQHTFFCIPLPLDSIPFCLWMVGPWHPGSYLIHLDSASTGFLRQPSSLWKCFNRVVEREWKSVKKILMTYWLVVRQNEIQMRILLRFCFLAEKGYETSYLRSQDSDLTVTDSIFRICFDPRVRALTIDQKTAVSALLSSTTKRQL